jgi:hypothetical protein
MSTCQDVINRSRYDAHPPALGRREVRKIFKRTVEACLTAKIATAEVVHIDAPLIRANASWDSLVAS